MNHSARLISAVAAAEMVEMLSKTFPLSIIQWQCNFGVVNILAYNKYSNLKCHCNIKQCECDVSSDFIFGHHRPPPLLSASVRILTKSHEN